MATPKRKQTKNKEKTKKAKRARTKIIDHNYKGKLSLVIPLYNEVGRIARMDKVLKDFEQYWLTPYEVILVNDGSSDETLSTLKDLYGTVDTEKKVEYKIINVEKNQGKGNALKEGVAESTGDHILTLDADMAASPFVLWDWLGKLEGKNFDDNTILVGSREHKESVVTTNENKRRILGNAFNLWAQFLTGTNLRDTQCGFKLYPREIGKALFEKMYTKGWAHDVELLHNAHLYNVEMVEMPINWKEIDESKVSVWSDGIKMGLVSFVTVIFNFFKFLFVAPFKELNKEQKLGGSTETPIYRFLFGALSVVLLFLMPYLSFDYGITADEEVQKVYGDLVLKYFDSGGVDEAALTYQNLYLYGGLFDYTMAWLHRDFFSNWDIYEMRHMFNAILGAFLMLFTGLLALTVSKRWSVAFWALLFIALSPRIFGHSMNNPKDIPFALGYVIALFFMMDFVRSLPKPGFRSIVGLIMGLAITINIRAGGILLIPYLCLFTGGIFILKKELRPYLNKVGYIFKLGVLVFGIIALGYFGGERFWPYALEDKLYGPFTALSEMSNFSTGIRMVWGGDHYWSDFLPWNYIIHWFSISTPVLILVLALGCLYPLLKDPKHRWIFLMTMFTGFFPVFYVIYKKSALYDGMRHFLFVYPILIVMAAYTVGFVLEKVPNKMMKLGASFVLLALLYSPIRWMIVSHPNQYVYFNELTGGIANMFNDYETDYWMNSTKKSCEWIIENIPEVKNGEEIRIGTQAHKSVYQQFKDYPNVKIIYTRYHDRVKSNWKYGLYLTRFVNRGYIESGLWPPNEEVIYTNEVDGVPLCVLTKRSDVNQKGPLAEKAFKGKDINKAISILEEITTAEPRDESAWLLMAQYALQGGQYPKAKTALDTLLAYSDSYSNGLGLMGMYYMSNQKFEEAETYFQKAVESNIKYVFGHYNLARIAASKQEFQKAIESLELFDRYGGKPAQGYDLAINIAAQMKNDVYKTYFTAKKMTQTGNWKDALPQLNYCLSIDPNYAPALKMKKDYENAYNKQKRLGERRQRLKAEGKIQ